MIIHHLDTCRCVIGYPPEGHVLLHGCDSHKTAEEAITENQAKNRLVGEGLAEVAAVLGVEPDSEEAMAYLPSWEIDEKTRQVTLVPRTEAPPIDSRLAKAIDALPVSTEEKLRLKGGLTREQKIAIRARIEAKNDAKINSVGDSSLNG